MNPAIEYSVERQNALEILDMGLWQAETLL